MRGHAGALGGGARARRGRRRGPPLRRMRRRDPRHVRHVPHPLRRSRPQRRVPLRPRRRATGVRTPDVRRDPCRAPHHPPPAAPAAGRGDPTRTLPHGDQGRAPTGGPAVRIPETMRVARLHGWGDVRVGEMAVPRPGPGEALLRVEACGVCGSDALEWYVETKAPAVLGHEPAGTIVAVGEGVTTLRPGDRVFTHHHAPCMACAECRRRLWSNCATWKRSQLTPGGFAEYTRIGA